MSQDGYFKGEDAMKSERTVFFFTKGLWKN